MAEKEEEKAIAKEEWEEWLAEKDKAWDQWVAKKKEEVANKKQTSLASSAGRIAAGKLRKQRRTMKARRKGKKSHASGRVGQSSAP